MTKTKRVWISIEAWRCIIGIKAKYDLKDFASSFDRFIKETKLPKETLLSKETKLPQLPKLPKETPKKKPFIKMKRIPDESWTNEDFGKDELPILPNGKIDEKKLKEEGEEHERFWKGL